VPMHTVASVRKPAAVEYRYVRRCIRRPDFEAVDTDVVIGLMRP
jgi:hypothetical protein